MPPEIAALARIIITQLLTQFTIRHITHFQTTCAAAREEKKIKSKKQSLFIQGGHIFIRSNEDALYSIRVTSV